MRSFRASPRRCSIWAIDLSHARGAALRRGADSRRRAYANWVFSGRARPPASVGIREGRLSTIQGKSAALLHSLARNHALVDGNKRLALAATIAFYGLNWMRLTLTNEDAYWLIIDVASGRLDDVEAIAVVLAARHRDRPAVAGPGSASARQTRGSTLRRPRPPFVAGARARVGDVPACDPLGRSSPPRIATLPQQGRPRDRCVGPTRNTSTPRRPEPDATQASPFRRASGLSVLAAPAERKRTPRGMIVRGDGHTGALVAERGPHRPRLAREPRSREVVWRIGTRDLHAAHNRARHVARKPAAVVEQGRRRIADGMKTAAQPVPTEPKHPPP